MKEKLMTVEFWASLIGAALMVLVTLGVLSQEESATVGEMLVGLVAAVLPIVALIIGYSEIRATRAAMGLLAEAETPSWLTAEFWMMIVSTLAMILVAGRIITQEEADMWQQLIAPLAASLVTIAAYVKGRFSVKAQSVRGAMLR